VLRQAAGAGTGNNGKKTKEESWIARHCKPYHHFLPEHFLILLVTSSRYCAALSFIQINPDSRLKLYIKRIAATCGRAEAMFAPPAVSVLQDRMTGEKTVKELDTSNSRDRSNPVFSDAMCRPCNEPHRKRAAKDPVPYFDKS